MRLVSYATLERMKSKAISVFFPTFNEEGNVEVTVGKAVNVLQDLKLEYEIIIVNDGSKDRTKQVAEDLAKKNSKIRVINHPKNLGYGEALKSGFYNARYDTIVYTDGDGQFDFSEVTKFLEKIDSYDLIIGYRVKRQDPFFRTIFKIGWGLSVFTFFRVALKDIDCGFKMVKREVLEKIPHLQSQRGAMINAEISIKAKKAGFKIGQVGVTHYPRLSGKSTGASLNVIIKSYLDLIKLWWKLKEEKPLFLIMILVLALAVFLRFYRLSEYMTFLGDEGRDALIVKGILVNNHFPLIGPPTSVGNIYLGPLYYYMMAISMAISPLNPVAAAGMNAVIGVLSVWVIYFLGKSWFNKTAGLIASYLYTISPVTIIYSKSSWNPNPAPLFAMISIWGLYKVIKTGNFLWLVLCGLMSAAALQMHYLALILIPILIILWLLVFLNKKLTKQVIKNLYSGTILGVISFLVTISPLFWFDLRHNFLNYRAIKELFSGGNAVRGDIFSNIGKVPYIYTQNLIGRYLAGENPYLTVIISLLVIMPICWTIFHIIKNHKINWPILILGVWMIIGLIGLSFYQGSIYDHYLGFINPTPFLLLGAVGVFFKRKLYVGGIIILLVLLSLINLQNNPNLRPPNNQLKRTKDVARFIINKTENKDFNFALIAKNNYDAAYQFYLEQLGHKLKRVPFDKTDQLFVVCEEQFCDPTHDPKYELVAFGWSKIDWMEEHFGVKIYKLIPNPSGKP